MKAKMYDEIIMNGREWLVIEIFENMMTCIDSKENIVETYNDRYFEVVGNAYDKITPKEEKMIKRVHLLHLVKMGNMSDEEARDWHNYMVKQGKIQSYKF